MKINENEKLLVLDLETDGLNPPSNILEVGIVSLNCNLEIKDEFSCLIKGKDIDPNAWIFRNSSLTLKEVMDFGKEWRCVHRKIQGFLSKHTATAYNQGFDFKFLRFYDIEIKKPGPDPMPIMTDVLKIPFNSYKYKWPSVQECLDYFGINEREPHRALDDARLEAQIIKKMIKSGLI